MDRCGRVNLWGCWRVGCVHIDGGTALALTRARRIDSFVDGAWRSDPTGDLGRINRTQTLLTVALRSLSGARPGPVDANRLADWVVENMTVSASLDRALIVDLVRFGLGSDDVDLVVELPVEAATLETGAAVLRLADTAAEAIVEFTDGTAAPDPAVEHQVGACDPSA